MRKLMFVVAMNAALSLTVSAAHAEVWCKFDHNKKPRLDCGYSSLTTCLQGSGSATCVRSQEFALRLGSLMHVE